MGSKWILFVIFSTYLLHEAWTLLPESNTLFRPFIFNRGQAVTVQYYVFAVSEYAIWLVLMAVIYHFFTDAREVMIWFVVFQFLELIEFFLTYNVALAHIPIPQRVFKYEIPNNGIGINITNIKIVVMFVLITKKIFRWNPGK